MAEQSRAVGDPTKVFTTSLDVTQRAATGNSVMLPGAAGFYFQSMVIVIGIAGTATNALIVYAMVASGEHKTHVLICNQNVLDLVSCFCLAVNYSTKIADIRLTGTAGYWLCMMILSENVFWCPAGGSLTLLSLPLIAVEH